MSQKLELDPFKAAAPEAAGFEDDTAPELDRAIIDDALDVLDYTVDKIGPYQHKDASVHHIGLANCCIALTGPGCITAQTRGQMARFFPKHDVSRPEDFDYINFMNLLKRRFRLGDDSKWTLFMTDTHSPYSPPQHIASVEHMVSALKEYETHFLESPALRHIAFFFMVPEYDTSESVSSPDSWTSPSDDDSATSPVTPGGSANYVSPWNWFAGIGQSATPSPRSHVSSPRFPDEPKRIVSRTSMRTLDDAFPSPTSVVTLGSLDRRPPQQIGILPQLDTDAGRGDVMEGDLYAIIPSPSPPSDAAWATCCSLLLLDPEQHKDPRKRSVQIPETAIKITPTQFRIVFWMLMCRSDRDVCGGLLAEPMGTGKTHAVISFCMMLSLIAYNMAEVKREWKWRAVEEKSGKSTPKKHLPQMAEVSDDTSCSCGNALGIQCYANPGGVTRRIGDRMPRGVSLIVVGQALMAGWSDVLKNGGLNRKYFEPAVFNTVADREVTPAPDLCKKLKGTVQPRARAGFHPKDWKPTVPDGDFNFHLSEDPGRQPERYIFMATHNPTKLTSTFETPFNFIPKGSRILEKRMVYGCPVGVMLVDEFHRVMNAKDQIMVLANEHKHMNKGDFDFWAVSGTPLPNDDLGDLRAAIGLLQRDEWDDPTHPQHFTRVQELENLSTAYAKAISAAGKPADVADFRSGVERFFRGDFIVRHTEESKFFGKMVFALQDVKPNKITHFTPDGFFADVQNIADIVKANVAAATGGNWEQSVRSSATFGEMLEMDILSTFPGAARVMLRHKMNFTAEGVRAELAKIEGRIVDKVPLFQEVLDEVIEDSPKLGTILRLIDSMALDTKKRPRKDHYGKDRVAGDDLGRKKMVIICPRLAEAAFVHLAIRKMKPDVQSVFFHKDLLATRKTAILKDFQSLQAQSAQVFVSSFGDGGTGINLFTANYQIQTGPLRLKASEDQSFGRTNRQGQQLPVQHYLLLTEDSPLDRIVVATQAKKCFAKDSDPFNVEEPVRFA